MAVRLLHYSDLEGAHDEPERLARLAGLVSQLRDEATLVVGTGDNTAPGVLSLLTEGQQALAFYERVEPDVETFGNHDFDYGLEATHAVVSRSPQTWVGSNLRIEDGSAFDVRPAVVRETAGHRVGFLGVLDESTPAANPAAAGLEVTPAVEAVRSGVADLRARGVEFVVVLAHRRRVDDLAAVPGVDAVLAGHLHRDRIEEVAGTPVVCPGSGGHQLLAIRLADGGWTARRHDPTEAPADPAVATALADRIDAAGLEEVVTWVADPIDRSRSALRLGETRIGNIVADAYRWATGADVGLQNSGGVREGRPLAGPVTVADLVSVLPFDEPVRVGAIPGRALRAVLEEAHGAELEAGDPDWWHGQVSGARIDRSADGGVDRVAVGGRPIDPDRTYTIATSDYLFEAGHEFPSLTPAYRRDATARTQYEVLIAYARAVGLDADIEGRIRREGVA